MLMSRIATSAPKPAATLAAFAPTTPPPRIVIFAGATPGTPPKQDAAAHLRPLEVLRAFLNAHPAGDFAHRRQQRQATLVVAERFVGDRRRTGCQKIARSARGRRQSEST